MSDGNLMNDAGVEDGRTQCLTARQARFVEEYLIDLNATQAALRAGYSPKTAYAQGARLLQKPDVAEAVDAAIQERTERLEIEADDVVLELRRIAFSDIGDYVEWDTDEVRPKESHEIPAEARHAIAKVTRTTNGSVQVSLHGKVRALDLLARHLGMYDIRRMPASGGSDASLLSDDELAQIIQEERAVKAASNGHGDDGFWAENGARIASRDGD